MNAPIFLGGACGRTTWRTNIAIPLLEKAGILYYNPQLPEGEWTPEHQYAEMAVKEAADVWLFVLSGETRGIASIGEVAYRIGQLGKIALAIEDVPPGAVLDMQVLRQTEIDDLNRGRVFLRAMAENHGIPVFSDIADATRYAIELVQRAEKELSLDKLRAIIARVDIKGFHFDCEKVANKFLLQIRQKTVDAQSDKLETMQGRPWLIHQDATEDEVVRTLLKAALTWEEHEIRERFHYKGARIFHPHFKLNGSDDSAPNT